MQRASTKPQALTPELIADIERASFALLDYLGAHARRQDVSPLSLFPQYRAVQEAAEAQRVHPADLWAVDWRWREFADDARRAARRPTLTSAPRRSPAAALMRGRQARPPRRISDLCAGLGAGAAIRRCALWRLAAAIFEAQAEGCSASISSPSGSPRACSRSSASCSAASPTSPNASPAICCSSARSRPRRPGHAPPRLTAARACSVADEAPVDYSVSVLGRFDPALIAHAQKRVTAAKEAWSAVAGGELHRLAGLAEQFALVGDSLRRLFPLGENVRHRAAARGRADASSEGCAAGAAGDGGGDQPAVPRGGARGRRLRRSRARRPRRAPRRAARRGAPGSIRPSRSRRGWRSSTGASPTARPWAAWSRSCAPRSPRPRSRSTSSSATPPTRGAARRCRSSSASMRGVLSVLGMDQASQALLQHARRGRRPGRDRGRSRARRQRPACSTAWPAT